MNSIVILERKIRPFWILGRMFFGISRVHWATQMWQNLPRSAMTTKIDYRRRESMLTSVAFCCCSNWFCRRSASNIIDSKVMGGSRGHWARSFSDWKSLQSKTDRQFRLDNQTCFFVAPAGGEESLDAAPNLGIRMPFAFFSSQGYNSKNRTKRWMVTDSYCCCPDVSWDLCSSLTVFNEI